MQQPTHNLPNPASNQSQAGGNPGWCARAIRIGRFLLEDVCVRTTEDGFNLNRTLSALADVRNRGKVAGANHPSGLPSFTAPRLLSVEVKNYLEELSRRGVKQGSLVAKQHSFRLLTLASGNILVSDINAGHVEEFWDIVRWWPEKASTMKAFAGLTDEQILAHGKASNKEPPSPKTMNAHLAHLAAFFRRLKRLGAIHHSPVDAFEPVKDFEGFLPARQPYAIDQLREIFDPESFIKWASQYPHRWWGPILGLYTGVRVGEIAQLRVRDIEQVKGIWCMHVRRTLRAQSIKNGNSERCIPLPPSIIDAGFLTYVQEVKKAKLDRLFPHLKAGISKKTGQPNGSGYGQGLSMQFSKYVHSVLDLPEQVAFHVFRHTLATALKDAGVADQITGTLTGHTDEKPVLVPGLATYQHGPLPNLLELQLDALTRFKPEVSVPRYTPGQFAWHLGPNSKHYP